MRPTFHVLYVLLFGFFCYSVNAQPLNFIEDFNDNSNLWHDKSNDVAAISIQDGMYTIDHHPSDKSGRYYFRDFIIDDSKDFIIETRLRFLDGVDNDGFGLFWGAVGWKYSNTLAISGNQYFKAFYYNNDQLVEQIPWKKDTTLVHGKKQFNILKVHKRDQTVYLFVNGTEIGRMPHRDFKETKIGFYFSTSMKLQVDYLKIFQYGDAQINLIHNPINGFKKENLGPLVNGDFSDRMPLISTDGNTLYYIKQDYEDIKNKKTEVYYSNFVNGQWTKAVNMGKPINNEGHNGVISVAADGNSMILMNTYKADGSEHTNGISFTKKTPSGWSIPTDIFIENYYNDDIYVEYCFSSTKNELLMAVKREDSRGRRDIYVSFKQGNSYSKPLNIGYVVNSELDEMSPFLAPDDRTLYFSSNGHQGYGSNDVFVTRRLDDTWTKWTKPENLGPEINSTSWDAYLTVNASGEYAYMVSSENSTNNSDDIFRIKLPESAKPLPVTLIKGKVIHAKTAAPLYAEIVYHDLKTGNVVGKALSDPKTGDYQIVLPSGKLYGFLAEKEQYYPISNFVDASALKAFNEVHYDLKLSPIEVGEEIRLNNLFFDTDKSDLKQTSELELDRLVRFLKNNPNISIQINGHTDNVGQAAYNVALSERRAQSVVNYLISKGIAKERLTSKGFGMTKPVASNDTAEGKASNRRVEMRILKM